MKQNKMKARFASPKWCGRHWFLFVTLLLSGDFLASALLQPNDGSQQEEGKVGTTSSSPLRASSSSSSSSSSSRMRADVAAAGGKKGSKTMRNRRQSGGNDKRALKQGGKGKGKRNSEAAQAFINATFNNDAEQDGNYTLDFGDASEDVFDVRFNITLGDWGIVSLAAAPELVNVIVCNSDGSIAMELSEDIDSDTPLEDLFPIGSLLVVSTDVFGPCRLTEEGPERVSIESPNLEDGYMVIEELTGTPQDLTIRGEVTSFYSMFRLAQISIVRRITDDESLLGNNSTANSTAVDNSTAVANSTDVANGSGDSSRRRLARLTTDFVEADLLPVPFISAELKLTASVLASLDEVNIDIGLSGIDISAKTSAEFTFDANFELLLKASGRLSLLNKELFALPIGPLGTTPIPLKIPDSEDSILDRLKLPSLKFGLYFEVAAIAEIFASIETKLGISAKLDYSSGRKQYLHYLRGPWLNIQSGTDTLVDNPQSRSLTTDFSGDEAGETEGDLQLFVGLEPRIALSATVVGTSLGIQVGFEARGRFQSPPWPPVADGDSEVATPLLGACNECHWARLVPSIRVDILRLTGFIGFNIKVNLFAFISFRLPTIRIAVFQGVRVRLELLTYCLADNDFMKCGMEDPKMCCDLEMGEMCEMDQDGEEMCSMPPTPAPSKAPFAPTAPPMDMPDPLPPFTPPPGGSGSSNGDPHIYTFDGVYYDCQGSGEFVLAQSLDSPLMVQVRHTALARSSSQISVNTGLAVQEMEGSPVIQFSFTKDFGNNTYDLDGCPLLMFVDGEAAELQNNVTIGNDTTVLVGIARDIRITFATTGIVIGLRAWSSFSGSFGCAMNVRLFIPDTFLTNNRIVGLLGTPNETPDDDWTTNTGEVLTAPSSPSERLGQAAYVYCIQNWCVQNEEDSLFSYENGTSFEEVTGCGIPFQGGVDLDMAPPELVALCGVDPACLIDGLLGGLEDAQELLIEQVEDDRIRAAASTFKFDPTTISVNQIVEVDVILDVSAKGDEANDVQSFVLFGVDPETGLVQGTPIGTLSRDGVSKVFSGVVNLLSTVGGEVFGFRAVPITNGAADSMSALSTTAITAVRSFTATAGVGGNATAALSGLTVASLEGAEVVLTILMGPLDEDDLLFSARFLDETFGEGCGSSPSGYLTLADDSSSKKKKKKKKSKSRSTSQSLAVLVGEALDNASWDGTTVIGVFVDFVDGSMSVDALDLELTLQKAAKKKKKKKKKEMDGALVEAVQPGSMEDPNDGGCPFTKVADVFIVANDDGSANVRLLVTSKVV